MGTVTRHGRPPIQPAKGVVYTHYPRRNPSSISVHDASVLIEGEQAPNIESIESSAKAVKMAVNQNAEGPDMPGIDQRTTPACHNTSNVPVDHLGHSFESPDPNQRFVDPSSNNSSRSTSNGCEGVKGPRTEGQVTRRHARRRRQR